MINKGSTFFSVIFIYVMYYYVGKVLIMSSLSLSQHCVPVKNDTSLRLYNKTLWIQLYVSLQLNSSFCI